LRNRRNGGWLIGIGIVLGITVLILLTWANFRYATENPGENDFLVHWAGTRSFLVDGVSPYSDQAALNIQKLAYGRAALPGENELRVAYPLYSIILFFPFALFGDFVFARALWMTVLEVCLFGMAVLSIRLVDWKPHLLVWVLFFIFSLFWYHALSPLINGNAVIVVALLITAAFWAIRAGADELAGVLLAFATIKPQVVLLVIGFVIFYAAFNRRWRLIAWTLGTVAILSAAAAFLQPDWILQNIQEVLRYPGYNPPGTPGAALSVAMPAAGQKLGWAISALVGFTLLIEWIAARNADFKGFLWTACLTLVLSQWSGIQTDPGNFIVVFPALTMVLALLDDRWQRSGWLVSTLLLLGLLIGLWWIFISTLTIENGRPQQSPVMFFPLPAVLGVMLIWVRWWAFHPANLWSTMLYDRQNPRL